MSERQTITVQSEDFDVGTELERMRLAVDGIGAIASFVGIVRDVNEELDVSEMTLEHYPAMTEKAFEHHRGRVPLALGHHRHHDRSPGGYVTPYR